MSVAKRRACRTACIASAYTIPSVGADWPHSGPAAAPVVGGLHFAAPLPTLARSMKALLVDDHPEVRLSLGEFLEQLGHQVLQASSGEQALQLIREQSPDLVLTDLRMPGMSGLDLLAALEQLDEPPPLALMTAFGEADTAIEALRRGAIDYLRKPIDVKELHRLVERVAGLRASASAPLAAIREEAGGLVVVGSDLARLVALADRLHAARDLPSLIEGETGVGKELFARRVHTGPGRGPGPFVAINCAAISTGLFESELFGYVGGAFTGAAPGGATGKLAAAAGGTIFLDEIGDLPLDQQAKLLRLLEDRTWYPVGGTKLQRLEARIICATNARLVDQVRERRFREDLYYRLKVGHLRIPPLRERREAIPALARVLLARAAQRRGRGAIKLSSAAETWLAEQSWPGNVRQLLHVLEQACLMEDGAVVDRPRLIGLMPDRTPPRGVPILAAAIMPGLRLPMLPSALALDPAGFDLDGWQSAIIAAALELNDESPVRTAAYLGLSRKVLYTLRKRYGLLPGSAGQ